MSSTALDELLDEPVETPEEIQDTEDTLDELLSDDPQEEIPQDDTPAEEIPEDIERITLNDFASDVEVEMEDVYELSVNMPFEMEAMTINELKDFKVANADIEEVRQQLETEKQEILAEKNAMRDVPQVSTELLNARAKVLSIQDQYNRVNWDQLRQTNPAEWSAAQQDFRNQFEGAKAEEANATKMVDDQKIQAQQFARDRLFEKLPELNDEGVAQESWDRAVKYAARYGFTKQDMQGINDPRLMHMLIAESKTNVALKDVKAKQVEKTPPKKAKTAPVMPSTKKAKLAKLYKRAQEGGKKELDAYYDAALS